MSNQRSVRTHLRGQSSGERSAPKREQRKRGGKLRERETSVFGWAKRSEGQKMTPKCGWLLLFIVFVPSHIESGKCLSFITLYTQRAWNMYDTWYSRRTCVAPPLADGAALSSSVYVKRFGLFMATLTLSDPSMCIWPYPQPAEIISNQFHKLFDLILIYYILVDPIRRGMGMCACERMRVKPNISKIAILGYFV